MQKKKVILGLSGGVDSAVSAYLLKKKGLDVTGVYCVMHDNGFNNLADAEKAAKELDINFEAIDLTDTFEKQVISYFINEYLNGRTPNPCFACNPCVKFKALLDIQKKIGADYIATGHYADISCVNGKYCIRRINSKKDQSYVLAGLNQNVLSRLQFPLSAFGTKEEVRQIARNAALMLHSKKDSQENCFIINQKYTDFIIKRVGKPPKGIFVLNGEKVGEHNGVIFYTIGQKKGLGLSLGKAVYIQKIDPVSNIIYLSEDPTLECRGVNVNKITYQAVDNVKNTLTGEVKIRYSASPCKATAYKINDSEIKIIFENPQRAATCGQAAVMYDENGNVLLSGIINEVF